ncbi:HAMP domain-containing sensor histidine kinase [Nonomuraea sp. NPDC046802]|uniref:sensor histidine kinase n=1 Tax=Nonomuraea sp. NPDC046802 TaxID=3154919 RepID=UPI003404CB4A
MDRLTKLRQYVDALGTPGTANGHEHRWPVHDELLTFPGEDEVTRLTRSVTRCMGRLEQALQRQRRFASDVSHELRNPIAGLRVRLEEARLNPRQTCMEELIDQALSDVQRLEAIVTDLLLLSRIEATGSESRHNGARKPEVVDLAELVASETRRRPDRLGTELRLEPGVMVMGIRNELVRVLTNLLDNAQRHASHEVEVEVRRNGSSGELIVSDDGEGIAEADRERIFERFVRLDASRKRDLDGSGLGLAITHEIASAHHGTIEAGKSASGGARFVFRLPLADGLAPSRQVHSYDLAEGSR